MHFISTNAVNRRGLEISLFVHNQTVVQKGNSHLFDHNAMANVVRKLNAEAVVTGCLKSKECRGNFGTLRRSKG